MRRFALALVLIALLATACGGDEPGATVDPTNTTSTQPTTAPTTSGPSRTGRTVDVIDNEFRPAELTVTVGTEVLWTHIGTAPHSVTAQDGSFDSHPDCDTTNFNLCMQPVEVFRFTFTRAGSFPYACKVHGELMSGTIIIE